eukprot:Ihof_evm3s201 gene=Ihof_evmTU3s201
MAKCIVLCMMFLAVSVDSSPQREQRHHDKAKDRLIPTGLTDAYRALSNKQVNDNCSTNGKKCFSTNINTDTEFVRLVVENKYVVVNFYHPLAVCIGSRFSKQAPEYCPLSNRAQETMELLAKVDV